MISCLQYLPVGNYFVNPQDIYQRVSAKYNSRMDVYEKRRINLQGLIDERFGGTQRKFAEAIDRQPDYVSRCIRGRKRIGETFARHVEESLTIPSGSLDQTPSLFAIVDAEDAKDARREGLDDHLTDSQIAERVKEEVRRVESEQSFRIALESGQIDSAIEMELEEIRARKKTPSRSPEHGRAVERDELEFFGHMDAWDSNTPLDEDEVELPLFREVELAAGAGQTQVVENHGAKLRFAKSTLSRAGVVEENAACAFVRGNSMEPVMPDGTCVGVNTGDTAVRDGEIYAIDHDGMLRVKYLHRRPGGGIKIVSQNASEHATEEYSAQDVIDNNIRIIGRVFWWSVLR